MMLSTRARYAVMAMVDLALHQKDCPVRVAEIAKRQEIPPAYLEQIFARLKRGGVVSSVRGPGGGYVLARKASDIAVVEIVSAAEEPMKMTRCGGEGHAGCMAHKSRCLTHDLWEGLGRQIHEYFSRLTLEDVCSGGVTKKFPRHSMLSPEVTLFAQRIEGPEAHA